MPKTVPCLCLCVGRSQWPSAVLRRGAGRSFPKTGGRCLASLLSPLPQTCSWLPPAPAPGLSQGPSPPPTSPSHLGTLPGAGSLRRSPPPRPQACLSSLPSLFTATPLCFLPHSHLDNHSLWEPKVFAIRCFKIIMYSIQVWWLPGPACPPGQRHLWEQASVLKEKASCPL